MRLHLTARRSLSSNHERLTVKLISWESMQAIWQEIIPPLKPQHIAKLAVEPKKIKHLVGTTGSADPTRATVAILPSVVAGRMTALATTS
jgi:hypothetical protein